MKLVTSLVALELAARGQFDLDVAMCESLPELKVHGRQELISARHLMNHTSGYRGVDISEGAVRWGFSWDKLIRHLHQHERLFAPGVVFNYEHTEHILLAEMIRRQSGRTAAEWVRALIFDDCGIEPYRFSPSTLESDAFVAHHVFSEKRGQFVAATLPPFSSFWEYSLPESTITLADIVSIGVLLQRAYDGTAALGISAAALRDLHRSDVHLPRQISSSERHERVPIQFGSALAQYPSGLFGHNASSSGQTTALRLDFERRVVIAVGVNAYVPYARDRVIGRLRSKLVGDSDDSTVMDSGFSWDEFAGGFSPAQLVGQYVGSYFGQVEVSSEGGGELHVALGSERRAGRLHACVIPSGNGRFALKSQVPMLLGFFPDPGDGRPVLAMGVHAYKKQRP